MRHKAKTSILTTVFCCVLICCLSASGTASPLCFPPYQDPQDEAVAWEAVPLRTAVQQSLGLSGGEGMQMVWGIRFAPSKANVVYLVSDTSQVWKSEDGGHTWAMKHKGFLANGGLSLVVAPHDEELVFVAGSVHVSGPSDPVADGIYRSKDGGDSWELVRQTAFCRLGDDKGGANFVIDQHTVYAGTHGEGLVKSTDGGDTWQWLDVLADTTILDIKPLPGDGSVLFLATKTGLFRFTDGATPTLEQIGAGLPGFPRTITIRPDNATIQYATVGKDGVYKSTDGGVHFSPCNTGLSPLTQGDGHAVTYFAMSPVNPDYLYASFYLLGGNHPYYSHDGGSSWQAPAVMDAGSLIFDVNRDNGGEYWATPIAPSPVDENVALTSGAGNHIEITTDGGSTWSYSGDGYSGGRAGTGQASFGWDPHNGNRFALFLIDFGVVLTKDGGATFKNLAVPAYQGQRTTPVGALDPTPGSKVIVTAVGGWETQIIAVTHDEGQNWMHITGTDDAYDFIAFHQQDPDIVYAGRRKSPDKGLTWTAMSKKVAAVYPGNGDIVYAKEPHGRGKTDILKSVDGGGAWTEPYLPVDVDMESVNEIAIDPLDPDRVYVATHYLGIFIWDGQQWVNKTETNGLEKDRFGTLSVRNVAIDPRHPKVVYGGRWFAFCGHANGIFRSKDYGASWENITAGLGPEFTTWAVSVSPHDGYVYLGSSHGTWRLPPPYDENGAKTLVHNMLLLLD